MSFSCKCFCYYRRHSNNNKICLLPSSACFQQRFHDWFFVLWYNSDEQHYYLTPTKSVICHIYAVSPFQLLSMVPFTSGYRYTKNWSVTVNYNCFYIFFITYTICLYFLSSHVLTALEFDRNYFAISFEKLQSHNSIIKSKSHKSEKYSKNKKPK